MMSISKLFASYEVFTEEPLSRYTTFRVGGLAEVLVKPQNVSELTDICEKCRANDIPLTILGDGSNVLVSDNGIRGVVVITNKMHQVKILDSHCIYAEAGARLSKVAETACVAGLAGLAFASGIPGTIGGAVYMNAGAFGHDIGEFCESVTILQPDGKVVEKLGSEMDFGYRKSFVANSGGVVLSGVFKLSLGETDKIRAEMKEINAKRKSTQPLEKRSAGSTFKRPEGFFAGKLIEDSGLKGYKIGGAKVSEKHAGFVVAEDGATANDIFLLMEAVKQKVHENFGVWLEPEVRLFGDF